jgi:hypothetical protein
LKNLANAEEAIKKIEEAAKETESTRESQATKIVNLFLESKPLLFQDERRIPYARLVSSPCETLRLRTGDFRAKLAGLLWESEEKVPGSEALASALNVLHHMALQGPTIPLATRVASQDGAIWVDLGGKNWRAIKITLEGWCIQSPAEPLFRRSAQTGELAEPIPGGGADAAWKLLEFLNLRENDTLLFMCLAVSYLIPAIPHPILVLHGAQGSTKTTLMVLLKELLDPSPVGVAALPRDERELTQHLDHTYVAFFDNVTSLPEWVSDALCRAATGAGFSKRQLYTDDDDIVYWIRRPVGVNAINIAAQKPDLLDRSVLHELEKPEQRRQETELLEAFRREQPLILGGFLDAIVKAFNMPQPTLPRDFRMNDFASWGYRVAEALGKSGQDFLEAYTENIRMQAEEAVRADIVAEVLLSFLDTCHEKKWAGNATTLLSTLRAHAEELHIGTRQKAWPKASHTLTRRLRLLRTSMAKIGCIVDFTRSGPERTRLISIQLERRKEPEKLPEVPSEASQASGASASELEQARKEASQASEVSGSMDGKDAKDASDTSSRSFSSVERLPAEPEIQQEKANAERLDLSLQEDRQEALRRLRTYASNYHKDLEELAKILTNWCTKESADWFVNEQYKLGKIQTRPDGFLEVL